MQTISHKCEVVSFKEYQERVTKEEQREPGIAAVEEMVRNRLYYLAGYYDPTTKRLSFNEGLL